MQVVIFASSQWRIRGYHAPRCLMIRLGRVEIRLGLSRFGKPWGRPHERSYLHG